MKRQYDTEADVTGIAEMALRELAEREDRIAGLTSDLEAARAEIALCHSIIFCGCRGGWVPMDWHKERECPDCKDERAALARLIDERKQA